MSFKHLFFCAMTKDIYSWISPYSIGFIYLFSLLFLQVMSIKAIGIAIKLTLEGSSQVAHFQTWVFAMVAITCIITQLNYLNKVSSVLFFFNYSRYK